ncbi:MAG: DUF3990 domain-containing protein [Eggerthellaceae bacterium]|nr:DUF3990 domain-containing protein [Eggerthellaceae bacterium]MBQ9044189.1 DUF3990 domain-containing protein [Eggerthellaceae bacterium]
MRLYHGSNVEIERIDLSLAVPFKDFGRGFYLTSMPEQAGRMALRVARFRGGQAVVTEFEAPDDLLESPELNIRVFDGVTIEWALFVINNRNRTFSDIASPECNHDQKYDIVFGPVGNDDITFLLEQFSNGYITEERLRDGLEFKRASDQYSFHTERAIARLAKRGAYHA